MSDIENEARRIFSPCGDDLALLLNQPEISANFIRNLLRARGVFVNSLEKKVLNEHLILSLLSPKELESLLHEVKTKEEALKLRTTTHEVSVADLPLAKIVQAVADLKFNDICADPNGNYLIEGDPSFQRVNDDTFRLDYSLIRNQVSSDWIKSKSRFQGKIILRKKSSLGKLTIEGYHSSGEAKEINSTFKKSLKQQLEKEKVINRDSEKVLVFGDFSNERRLAFFIQFTQAFPREDFSFEKISDLDFKVDDDLVPAEETRISWMKNQISKSKISGTALQDAFLLKEKDCWGYIKVWRMEMKFSFSSSDADGSFRLLLEFDGYGRKFDPQSRFQISIDGMTARKFQGSMKATQDLFLSKMNEYASTYAAKILAEADVVPVQPV